MHIGLTFDLRSAYLAAGYGEEETAEFDSEVTIEAFEQTLERLGHRPERIGHARQLVERLAAGDRWDLVFNICEGLHGLGREAQVPAILDVYDIPYTFSDPLVMALCLHKGLTKAVVRQAGLPTPDYLVVQQPDDLAQVRGGFPLFIKPVAEGTGKGTDGASIVHDAAALERGCRELLRRFRQPVLVETYLPGREFTVGLLGTGRDTRVLGTMEILLGPHAERGVYSYQNKENSEALVDYRFLDESDPQVAEAQRIAVGAWQALGCRDAGRIDLRCDSHGQPQFLEVNPLAGLHPTHSDLPMLGKAHGVSYEELIGHIVDSAAQRVRSDRPIGRGASQA